MILLTDHFARKERSNEAERLRQQRWFIKAREQREQQQDAKEARDEAFQEFAASVIAATEAQIKSFQAKLDAYDEATVRALELNQQQIDAINDQLREVRVQIQDKLNRAHVLEDGRRVFLTEDGSHVFDEHGTEVTREELDFNLINPANPTWESLLEDRKTESALNDDLIERMEQREDILKFQEKLDDARERSKAEDFTKDELDELEADLKEALPDAVAKQMPGGEPEPDAAKNSTLEQEEAPQTPRRTNSGFAGVSPALN